MTKAYGRFLTAFFCLFLGGLLAWHLLLPDRERSETLHNELEKGFQATRSEIVDVVEAVSQKVERLENTIKSVEDVTAQNAFDVQLMKRRA